MNERLRTLPEDIEHEIENYILTESMRLTMLLDKYPLANMETFFQDFTVEQLDKIYRYGCVSKIFAWCSKGYAMNIIQPIIVELTQLPTHIIIIEFTKNCWPKGGYNDYWKITTHNHRKTNIFVVFLTSSVRFSNIRKIIK